MDDAEDLSLLKKIVAESDQFLASIKSALAKELPNQQDATAPWLREIAQIDRKRKLPKVIVGIVGATGSGKSSIINAILGETQLVPTNCMRACTAVVTEISYNNSTTHNYRATIEFVSSKEWRHELELLFGDIITHGKASGNIKDDSSAAGIAFAKVQAVYPHLSKHDLSKTTVDQLLQLKYVQDVIGASIDFQTSTARELHEKIQKYVDSTEKLSEDFQSQGLQASALLDKIAYWPLIRRVCIYTRAPVLETGCVLVDLPGVADSNAARAAVAQRYLQNCSALWIVAPIIRAVDDKCARTLLGEGFKRQLWRDGTLQRLTFVCSKTDEISIGEARTALKRYHGYQHAFETIDHDRTIATDHLVILQQAQSEVKTKIEEAGKLHKEALQEESVYKKLHDHAKGGQTVHPLVRVEIAKRKLDTTSQTTLSTPTKKTKYESHMSQTFESRGVNRSVANDESPSKPQVQFREDHTKPALEISEIKAKLVRLKDTKRQLRVGKVALKEKGQALKDDIAINKADTSGIKTREWITCVLGRNEISSHAIRADFAAGLQDIARDEKDDDEDEEAEEAEIAGEHTETELVSRGGPQMLPVFCVSAKGYQKMQGDMEGEKVAACFESLKDTGIPSLQKHARQLSSDKMTAALHVYNDAAKRLLTSLQLWSSGASSGPLSESCVDDKFYADLVETFIANMSKIATATMTTIEQTVNTQIFGVLLRASRSASSAAVTTAMTWVASRRSDNPTPGLHYQTFKAVVRRTGTFARPLKSYDFNADLLMPYMRKLDAPWDRVFNTQVEEIFKEAIKQGAKELDNFAIPFGNRLKQNEESNVQSTVRRTFDEQVKLFTKSLGGLFRTARKTIEKQQREANRVFETSVKSQMEGIYNLLAQETGTGSYDRIREKLNAHLDRNSDHIFDTVSTDVALQLRAMLDETRKALLEDLAISCGSLARDCKHLSQQSRDFDVLSEATRNAIINVLNDAETRYDSATTPIEDAMVIDPNILANDAEVCRDVVNTRDVSLPLRPTTPIPVSNTTEKFWDVSEVEDSSGGSDGSYDDSDDDDVEA